MTTTLPVGASMTPSGLTPVTLAESRLSLTETSSPALSPAPVVPDAAQGRTAVFGAGPILAIDPGSTHSGIALIEPGTCRPLKVAKMPNADVLDLIRVTGYDHLSIEMIASYGMAVGKEVFDTCVWIGRFVQHHNNRVAEFADCVLVYRREVKLHHCHSAKAKDANITQALIDRFAYGEPNRGKGTKAEPGWFYGFAADIWQAYALAVHASDSMKSR
jgi:hypothetical protein